MTARFFVILIAAGAMALMICGCDLITGGSEPPGPIPTAIPGMPGQPVAIPVPGQPVAIPVPGQPVAIPVPGQPVAIPVPGQPVAIPVPGQPVAVPPPGQLVPIPVPGQPVAAPVPGQPVAPPVPGQPVAPPVATPPAPVVPTGDLLTDRMNEAKAANAVELTATSMLEKVELKKGKTQSYEVQLPGPPYCHSYLAVGDDNVKEIKIDIESPAGVKETTSEKDDNAEDNLAIIANHCPTMAGLYKLNTKLVKGKGEIAVQVFSK